MQSHEPASREDLQSFRLKTYLAGAMFYRIFHTNTKRASKGSTGNKPSSLQTGFNSTYPSSKSREASQVNIHLGVPHTTSPPAMPARILQIHAKLPQSLGQKISAWIPGASHKASRILSQPPTNGALSETPARHPSTSGHNHDHNRSPAVSPLSHIKGLPHTSFRIWRTESNSTSHTGDANIYVASEIPQGSYTIDWQAWPANNGGYANIFKGTWNGRQIALKQLRSISGPQKIAQRFNKEVQVWCRLKHSNILPFLGVFTDPEESMYMISPWCKNGDINNYLRSVNASADRLILLSQVATGLAYLHEHNIVHGDLRGANILVSDTGAALVADFGLSKLLLDALSVETTTSLFTAGAAQWMAPELITKTDIRVTKEGDVYAYAMTVIEASTGAAPFNSQFSQIHVLVPAILAGRRPERPDQTSSLWLSDSIWDLVQACWGPDPESRPTAPEVRDALVKERTDTSV